MTSPLPRVVIVPGFPRPMASVRQTALLLLETLDGPLTDLRTECRRPATFGVGLTALALSMAMLDGCTPPPPPAVSTTRLYAIDQQGGAKNCTTSAVKLTDGKEATATLSVENDGGWCAVTVAAGDKPYAAGLLTGEPAHGTVYVHSVGDATRIDYTPDRGFTGADTYVVKFLPGSPTLRVAVTVTPGSASVVAPPPAPPQAAPTTKGRARS